MESSSTQRLLHLANWQTHGQQRCTGCEAKAQRYDLVRKPSANHRHEFYVAETEAFARSQPRVTPIAATRARRRSPPRALSRLRLSSIGRMD